MERLVLALFKLYFGVVGRLAPGTAARTAFRMFRSPRRRSKVPSAVESTMAEAERPHLLLQGNHIQAYRWPAAGEAKGRVLLVHGWESRAARMANWVPPLLERGYEVLAFDGPAHGESEGRLVTPLEFAGVITEMTQRFGPMSAFVGHSFGVIGCAAAVESTPSLAVEKLVFLAGPDRVRDEIARFSKFLGVPQGVVSRFHQQMEAASGRPVSQWATSVLLAESPLPILLLHDQGDLEVPFEEAQALARQLPTAQLSSTSGLGHHRILRDSSVVDQALAFLDEEEP